MSSEIRCDVAENGESAPVMIDGDLCGFYWVGDVSGHLL